RVLVEIAEALAGWHDKAVVEQSLHSIGWRVFVKADPADQSLVAEGDEVFVGADRLVGLGESELSFLGKLDELSCNRARCNRIDVLLGRGAGVGNDDSRWRWGCGFDCARAFRGCCFLTRSVISLLLDDFGGCRGSAACLVRFHVSCFLFYALCSHV